MLLLAATTLPEGPGWTYELKLDGYRAIGVKTGGAVQLRSRSDKDFNPKYPAIATALAALPDETVVDGEVVALDEAGRPSFSALQNGATGAAIFFYVFDVMVLGGRNLTGEALAVRRELLSREILPLLTEPVREARRFEAALSDLVAAAHRNVDPAAFEKTHVGAIAPRHQSAIWWQSWMIRSISNDL
jgi:bifunctional non-homologous end joining protein LigD